MYGLVGADLHRCTRSGRAALVAGHDHTARITLIQVLTKYRQLAVAYHAERIGEKFVAARPSEPLILGRMPDNTAWIGARINPTFHCS